MRIYKNLFFSVLLVLAGCSSDQTPADIIPQKTMPALLAEINIIDGGLYNTSQLPDSLYRFGMGRYMAVFEKYHTDTAQFKKSFTYYTKNPEKLDAIYDGVIKILEKKNDSISKIKVPAAKPVVKKDSIAAALKKDSIAKKVLALKKDSVTKAIAAKKDSIAKAKKAKSHSPKIAKPANAVSIK